jgi:hypothetical protein
VVGVVHILRTLRVLAVLEVVGLEVLLPVAMELLEL